MADDFVAIAVGLVFIGWGLWWFPYWVRVLRRRQEASEEPERFQQTTQSALFRHARAGGVTLGLALIVLGVVSLASR